MNTYTITGAALQLTIKADTFEEAMRILSAPLIEVGGKLKGIYFERIGG